MRPVSYDMLPIRDNFSCFTVSYRGAYHPGEGVNFILYHFR